MNPMLHIRRDVLAISQAEMGAIAGARQATVSRWETGQLEPDRDQLGRIRAVVRERGLAWSDAWFFDPVAVSSPSSDNRSDEATASAPAGAEASCSVVAR